jgi:6-phosphofructokinase 1
MSTKATVKRVGIVFSGGPAPAANAVISACALQFLDAGVEVFGILDGFLHLSELGGRGQLVEGRHYLRLEIDDVSGIRNRKPVLLRSSHSNPSSGIDRAEDLADPSKNGRVAAVYAALESLGLDAIITVGGDETLRTANHLRLFPLHNPAHRAIPVVHLPKTIDNDYYGIDWTFGFTSAVDFAAREIRNLGADAQSTCAWYVLELMGRQAGWLTYAAGIAGEATRMISVEDVDGTFDLEGTAEDIADLMITRDASGKCYGIVCVAEGLAALLPEAGAAGVDGGGYSRLGSVRIAERLAAAVEVAYERRTGAPVRVRSKQIGYETRCAEPLAFDILLGSQLGVGAYRAIAELGHNGCMVSVRDQLELVYVPFEELVDPETLRTRVRFISRESDFYRLARALEYHSERCSAD